jgi:hypothetical protein
MVLIEWWFNDVCVRLCVFDMVILVHWYGDTGYSLPCECSSGQFIAASIWECCGTYITLQASLMSKQLVHGVTAPILRVYGEISRPVCRVRNVDSSTAGYVQTCGLEFVWGKWGRGLLHWTCRCVSHKKAGQGFELAYCDTENRPFFTGRQSLHRATGPSDDSAWRNRAVTPSVGRSVGRHLSCYAADFSL